MVFQIVNEMDNWTYDRMLKFIHSNSILRYSIKDMYKHREPNRINIFCDDNSDKILPNAMLCTDRISIAEYTSKK